MGPNDEDFAAVQRLSRQWMDAWMAQDRATLDCFLAPDFALIVSSVPTHPLERSNWLEIAVDAYVCTRFDYSGIHCRRISADLVAMSAIADFDATMAGIDRSGRYFVTDLWRRTGSGWQVCARYSSRPGEADASVKALLANAP